ncbi:MAG TPA: zinc-dependent alcohol dehydrogenase family protein [Candidatus Krumholzibacteria bacterium]|nr:zinc-dependent alcohol dehydrogenase family protein [Candidatus Krumholzibacteria bacterium]HPD70712.1 zinc-dependent alcohol dehydrogenase family protein [Candidatus Krumholzibacteria bacterium]HRY39588.1 zinc-dependent alcohol dehydrogenase family protein [Candidatus Krumholzibacteria bacterium]
MRAMILRRQGAPLEPADLPDPVAGPGQVLLAVHCCGVCRTDLHVVDGELAEPRLPLVGGHQIVGSVLALGAGVTGLSIGQRVGVPWLGGACGQCRFCAAGRENLCERAVYTGYQRDGGFAERCVADARFCFALPPGYSDLQVAPLLCAGLIGYRAWRFCRGARRVGFYGFGAAAHILAQVARHAGSEVYAFCRPGDRRGEAFARSLGCVWAGPSDAPAPVPLDAAIVFAPVGPLVPAALRAVDRGGRVVCAGIHMSDIPSFPYRDLWQERSLVSVANLTRQDGEEFLALAPRIPVTTTVTTYPLADVNTALDDLRRGRFDGAAVVVVDPEACR